MTHFLISTLEASLDILLDTAPFMILGIAAGGAIKAFFSAKFIAGHLGGGKFAPVIKSAIIGVPLPLCSCSVAPTAASLKKQGANRGAVSSFLISTPESSMDSIALTYVLIDPLMTVIRPVAAFITATVAGTIQNFLPETPQDKAVVNNEAAAPADPLMKRLRDGQTYAFFDLWHELLPWFAGGILAAGVISALVPPSFFESGFGGGITGMLIVMAVGMGMYICSSASTPVAAAMIMKGMSPGTALVFMLVGPAVNMASLGMISSILGKRGAAVHLACLAVCTVLLGLGVDMLYSYTGITIAASAVRVGEVLPPWLQWSSVAVLAVTAAVPFLKRKSDDMNNGSCCSDCGTHSN
jgi:uncharacterized membrane protein YraQ (UPF0718 family)